MARVTIRSTYALDVETVRALQGAAGEVPSLAAKTVAALDDLQQSLGLTRSKADAWARRVRAERRSASARREPRRR
jgi:hypothetical protein